jgi:acetyltransferase
MDATPTQTPTDGPGYPGHLIEDWRLPDGTRVTIRPIRPEDLALETAFVAGLSRETGYRRLLSPRQLQPDELWRFTHIDYEWELALIATADIAGAEQQLAVARYVRDGQGEQAEFAIVVGDAWQASGLGTKLLQSLIRAAAQAGVRRLSASTLSNNEGMLALARKLGFQLLRDPGDTTVTYLSMTL